MDSPGPENSVRRVQTVRGHRTPQARGHTRCGSLLYSLVRDAAFVHVTLGTLMDSPSMRPSAHIFVGSTATWYTITDALPQYDEWVERRASD